MTTTDTTTTPSEISKRHAAAIYRLIDLRLQFMTEAVADVIEYLGERPDRSRTHNYAGLTDRYRNIASEWLVEPIPVRQHNAFPVMAALARFVAFVNVDRGLIDRTTNDATIVGDDEDRHHVSIALTKLIGWVGQQDEAQQMAEMARERAQLDEEAEAQEDAA
jgi:hypothetical protein